MEHLRHQKQKQTRGSSTKKDPDDLHRESVEFNYYGNSNQAIKKYKILEQSQPLNIDYRALSKHSDSMRNTRLSSGSGQKHRSKQTARTLKPTGELQTDADQQLHTKPSSSSPFKQNDDYQASGDHYQQHQNQGNLTKQLKLPPLSQKNFDIISTTQSYQ